MAISFFKSIAPTMYPAECYRESYRQQWRIPEYEPIILTSAEDSYWYARDVIKGRWPEAESIILTSSVDSYYYARDVIKERWPEAESAIMTCEWSRGEYYECFEHQFTNEEQSLWLLTIL